MKNGNKRENKEGNENIDETADMEREEIIENKMIKLEKRGIKEKVDEMRRNGNKSRKKRKMHKGRGKKGEPEER